MKPIFIDESNIVSVRKYYGKRLVELADVHDDIVGVSADLAESTGIGQLGDKHPHRMFNVGISEQDMVGVAAGLALMGKSVWVSTFAIFATGRCWDQIRQSICYSNLPVKIVASHGGISVGQDGPTHQASEDIALMRVMPRMNIIIPCDWIEMRHIMDFIYHELKEPVYVRTARILYPTIHQDKGYQFNFGQAEVLGRGKDITIIACGYMVTKAILAANRLIAEGYEPTVLNMHTIKPIDYNAIKEFADQENNRSRTIIVAEEHSVIGGLGSAVAEVLAEECCNNIKLIRIGLKEPFAESGEPEKLLDKYKMSSDHIYEKAKEVLIKLR